MGDVAMTVPVILLLLNQYPHLRLTVVSKPEFKEFFSKIPSCNFFSVETGGRHKGISGLWNLSNDILQLKPDGIADLHDVLRTKILSIFFKLKSSVKIATIDKGRKEKNKLCRKEKNKKLIPLKSTHQRYADVFKNLGFNIHLTKEASFLTPEKSQRTTEFLNSFSGKILIGLAPFARYKGKTYPLDLTIELIDILLKEKQEIYLFLFGSKTDLLNLERLKNLAIGRIEIISDHHSLSEQLSIISSLKLMISMDSANMHIASMLNVRVLSLWGYTHPFLGFYGWQQQPEDAFLPDYEQYPTLPSSTNGSHTYQDIENCMRSIAPKKIADKICQIIS
jgi:ADP-heptose:LPS heptosyltransferase